ncbi:MAG: STAS/SEC14 domain-containing protein [Bacteroidales bacterium]|nr:STAS/SEC14 domain-containing protein [Bacteroidales bacterium]
MANGARFINYKGIEIYFVDYTNIKTTEDFLEVIKGTNEFREKAKAMGKRDVLMLVDITGSYVYGETMEALKRAAKLSKELTRKEAVIGISGAKKIMLRIVQMFSGMQLRPFNTIDEAKEWLIKG